ncbi:MAG: zinc ribbon-containing protein [Gammaproteobacteria bacterium]|nr:zinc ribbon-containing protein [Gammaproteobacteria bacterium]
MSDPDREHNHERWIQAYNRMLERVKHALEEAEEHTLPKLGQAVDWAKEHAVELGELTRNEAEKVGEYVKRDLHDAGEYLSESSTDLRGWLRFDLELIEGQLLELFSKAADKTSMEWAALRRRMDQAARYHTGEVTGPGSLECMACGEVMAFHRTGHIPPCPRCHGTVFERPHRRRAS